MVQKYDMHSKDGTWDDNYEMRAEQHGDYVTYDDYLKLSTDYYTLLNRYNHMAERIKEVFEDIV